MTLCRSIGIWGGWVLVATGFGLLTHLMLRDSAEAFRHVPAAASAETATNFIDIGTHDFRTLIGDQLPGCELRLRNDSSETWTVSRTWHDCGCVSIASFTPEVEPGADLVVTIQADTRQQSIGKVRSAVYLETGPTKRVFRALALATIVPVAYYEPQIIRLSLPQLTDDFWCEAQLYVPVGMNVDVRAASPALSAVHVQPSYVEDRLEIRPLLVEGWLPRDQDFCVAEIISRVWNAATDKTVRLPIVIERQGRIEVSPKLLLVNSTWTSVDADPVLCVQVPPGATSAGWTVAVEPPSFASAEIEVHPCSLRVLLSIHGGVPSASIHITNPQGLEALVPVVVQE